MNVERVVKNFQALAVPPFVADAIHRVTTQNGSVLDLARIIESDATLTIRVLRSINSAAYGLPRKIANIHEAVALLGFRQLGELCADLPVLTQSQITETRHGFNRVELWKHSLGTAVASKLINEQITGRSDPTVYIAGLLSNIGRTILDTYFPEEFQRALKLSFEEELSLRHAERRVFGVPSETVGYWAASTWELAECLTETLNENYGLTYSGIAWIVDLAAILTESLGMGSSGNRFFSPLKPGLLSRNFITKNTLESMIEMLDDSFNDLRAIYCRKEQPQTETTGENNAE
jgi:HD-like signal output (HDOD) protein